MRRWMVLLGFLFFAVVLSSAQAAAPAAPQQGTTEGWKTHANADHVNILRARGDTLWAGSEAGGLVQWDVTNDAFVHLMYPQDRLAGNTVTAITIAPDGALWAATRGGVSRYPPNGPGQDLTLKKTSRRAGAQATVVERAQTGEEEIRLSLTSESEILSAFAPGYLMFGTDPTIYFYRDWNESNRSVKISPALHRTVEPPMPVYAVDVGLAADDVRDVKVDRDGRVWISTVNGISIYDGGNWTVYTEFNSPLISNDAGVMAVDGAGRLWISHQERGQFTMFDGGWHAYSIDGTIQSLTVRPDDGNVWAATSRLCDPTGTCRGGGVWAFDGSTWRQRYRGADGIADDEVHSIAFGAEGRIWLGHELAAQNRVAVSRWTGSGWQVYQTVQQAIEADFSGIVTTQTPTDLWTSAAGRVWTRHLGAVRGYAPGAGWQALYTGSTVLNSNHTRAIATDEAGRVWVGAHRMFDGQNQVGGGINFWDGARWAHYMAENSSLADNLVEAISVGRGEVWVKTLTGFSRFSNGTWTIYLGADITPIVEDDYWSIINAQDLPAINDNRLWAVDGAGRVWVWQGEGASYYRPDTGWTTYTFKSTLRRKEPAVTYLQADAGRQETFIRVSAADIPDGATAQSHFANGYLMLGDDATVYRYESFEPDPRADATRLQISPRLKTQHDMSTAVYAVELGLLSDVVSDVAFGPDGHVWFATRPDRVDSTDVYGGVSVLDVDAGTWEQLTVHNTSRRGQVVGSVTARVEIKETHVPADFGSEDAAARALSSGFVMFGGDPTVYRHMGYRESDDALVVFPIFNTLKYPTGVQQTLLEGTQIYAVDLGLLGTPQGDASADRLALDVAGRMWIAVPDIGISVLDDLGEWTNYRREDDGLANARVSGMLARGDEMWVWTDGGGISVFRNGNWQTYDVFNSGLVDDRVEALAITLNSEAWVATHGGGISVLTLPGFRLDMSAAALVVPGGTGKVHVEVVPVGGFNDSVMLTVEGQPPGVDATFQPASISGGGVAELTINVSELVGTGSYPLTVIGRSPDGLSATRRLILHVVSSIHHMYLPLVAR